MQAACQLVSGVLYMVVMRALTIAVLFFIPVAGAQTIDANQSAQPVSAKEKLEYRMRKIVSPMTQLGVFTGAAINQWRDEPSEWGQGWDAYGRAWEARRESLWPITR